MGRAAAGELVWQLLLGKRMRRCRCRRRPAAAAAGKGSSTDGHLPTAEGMPCMLAMPVEHDIGQHT